MKKLVMKLLLMAKKDGDRKAAALLKHIETEGLMNKPLEYFAYLGDTVFTWGEDIKVAYRSYGSTEEIVVTFDGHHWTLCE